MMKKVICDLKPSDVVLAAEANEYKIYVLKSEWDICKAHKIYSKNGEKFAFVALDDSTSWANGTTNSLSNLLMSAIHLGEIYEFDTMKEFVSWLSENV